ncbi:MAG: hypothetical protein ACXV47_09515 [Halobacteriota archaeon]
MASQAHTKTPYTQCIGIHTAGVIYLQLSINLKPDLVTRIDADAAADNLSRSGVIVECIHEHFDGTADF